MNEEYGLIAKSDNFVERKAKSFITLFHCKTYLTPQMFCMIILHHQCNILSLKEAK